MDFLDYPKSEAKNLVWRAVLLSQAEERDDRGAYTARALEIQKYLTTLSKENMFFFFNAFLWTYDPRPDRGSPDKPFCTYDRQNDYLRWLERTYRTPHNVSGLVDKARDVGFSFTTIGWIVWHWLFDDGFNAKIGSRKEEYVDKKGDPDCLFYKAEYMLNRLPNWLLPPGFDMAKNRRFMMIDRPDKPNTISGESANPDFGRAGRQSFVLMDEFGFWPWARPSWEACGESAHFRLAGTTPPPSGTGSHAYKLRAGQSGRVEVFTFDYTAVPWKDSRWIQQAKEGKSEDEFKREVMRSYQGSTSSRVYAKEWYLVKRDDRLTYNPDLPLYVSMDFGYDGLAIIWWQKNHKTNWNYVIDAYWNKNQPIDFYLPFISGTIGQGYKYETWELKLIAKHKEWKRPTAYFGDPDVKKRSLETGRSLRDYLSQAPNFIYVQTHEWTAQLTHYNIRENCKVAMKRLSINPEAAAMLDWAMENARYPEPREASESTATTKKPVHDDTSHLRTAFEYYIINEPQFDDAASDPNLIPAGTENDFQEEYLDDNSFRSLLND